jgi:two-component system response regulator FixJ
VITGHGDVPMAVTALKNGAIDFLEKPFTAQTLIESVRAALTLDHRQRERVGELSLLEQRYATLTLREREVFERLITDEPSKRIASNLQISPRTLEHHREHVLTKMHARSLRDLLVMALLLGRYEPHVPQERSIGPQ